MLQFFYCFFAKIIGTREHNSILTPIRELPSLFRPSSKAVNLDPEKFHRESRTQKFYKEFRMDGRWFYQWEGNSLDGSQKAKVYENDNAIISVVGVTDEGIYFTEYIDTSEVRSFSAYSKVEFDNANKVQIYNRYDFFKELKARGLATGVLK